MFNFRQHLIMHLCELINQFTSHYSQFSRAYRRGRGDPYFCIARWEIGALVGTNTCRENGDLSVNCLKIVCKFVNRIHIVDKIKGTPTKQTDLSTPLVILFTSFVRQS